MDVCLNMFNRFPKLQIDLENVAFSFRKWHKKSKLISRLAVIKMATEKVGNQKVFPKFRQKLNY